MSIPLATTVTRDNPR